MQHKIKQRKSKETRDKKPGEYIRVCHKHTNFKNSQSPPNRGMLLLKLAWHHHDLPVNPSVSTNSSIITARPIHGCQPSKTQALRFFVGSLLTTNYKLFKDELGYRITFTLYNYFHLDGQISDSFDIPQRCT